MIYTSYRLSFPNGVHFGERGLQDSNKTFCSDTLFSALYLEAMKCGRNEMFFNKCQNGEICFSDAFPYMGDVEYLPKPMCRPNIVTNSGDSVVKKAFKNLSYIPMDKIGDYMQGKLDAVLERDCLSQFGYEYVKTSGAISGLEETKPYHIGTYYYREGNGLHLIVGTDTKETKMFFFELLNSLSFVGIGGERSSGLGRFSVVKEKLLSDELFSGFESVGMLLNTALPQKAELKKVIKDATYQVKKRSGFVYSEDYADEYQKKRDLYMFAAGSCFQTSFNGDIYDVSNGGRHSVYRYGKPMFYSI